MNTVKTEDSPYRDIHPYRYRDRALFFGRKETVSEMLVKVLLARLVVLFGESGTGKSSMLNAGLVPELEKEGFRPERLLVQPDGPIIVERIEGDAAGSFLPSIFAGEARGEALSPPRTPCSLENFARLVRRTTTDVYPVLIFDQFEQLFTLFDRGMQESQASILRLIFDIINDESLRVKVVISMREDFVGKLEILAKDYPRVFDNRVRLKQLDSSSARDAILRPFDPPNPFRAQLNKDLADVVVADLAKESPTGLIHPTQLQIVCARLWSAYADAKKDIGVDEYKKLDRVAGIIRGYLESELGGLVAASRNDTVMALGGLITESGTRDVVSSGKLRDLLVNSGKMKPAALKATLEFLQNQRLVNATPRNETYYFEIASEYLISPVQHELEVLQREEQRQILAAKEREESDRRITEAKLAQGKLFKRLSYGLAGAVTLALVGLVTALTQRALAETNLKEAQEARAVAEKKQAELNTLLAELSKLTRNAIEQAGELKRQAAELQRLKETAEGNEKKAVDAAQRESSARDRAEIDKVRHTSSSLRARAASTVAGDPQLGLHLALGSLGVMHGLPQKDRTTSEGRLEAEQLLQSVLQNQPVLLGSARKAEQIAAIAGQPDMLTFSRDGKRLATVEESGRVRVWDTRLGEMIAEFPPDGSPLKDRVLAVAFTSDGRRIATVSESRWDLWDVEGFGRIHGGDVESNRAASFSHDARYLASVTASGTISILDVNSGVRRRPFVVADAALVAVNTTGDLVAVSKENGEIALYDRDGSERGRVQAMPSARAARLAFIPGTASENLGVLFEGGRFRYWDTLLRYNRWEKMHEKANRFFPDGAGRIATAAPDGTVKVWNERSGAPLPEMQLGTNLRGWTVGSDGRWLAAVSTAEKRIGVLEFASDGYPKGASGIAFNTDARWLAVAGLDGSVDIYSSRLARRVLRLVGHRRPVLGIAFSRDGKRIATGSADGSAVVWNSRTGQEQFSLATENQSDMAQWDIHTVTFSPDGAHLVTGDECGRVRVWDTRQGKELEPFEKQACDAIYSIEFGRDGRLLVTGNESAEVKVHDFKSRKVLSSFKVGSAEQRSQVAALALSPGMDHLAVMTSGGAVDVWERIQDPTPRRVRALDKKDIYGISFGEDAKQLVTISRDGTVDSWSMPDGQRATRLAQGLTAGQKAVFAQGGRYVAVSAGNDNVRVYPLDHDDLVRQALTRLSRPLTDEECARYMLSEKRSCASSFQSLNRIAEINRDATDERLEATVSKYREAQTKDRALPEELDLHISRTLAESLTAEAHSQLRSKNVAGALEALERAQRLDREILDDPRKTAGEMAAAFEINDRSARVAMHLTRGDQLARQYGRRELAIKAYERALTLDPAADTRSPTSRANMNVATYHVSRGDAAARVRGDRAEAIKEYSRALELDPASLKNEGAEARAAELLARRDSQLRVQPATRDIQRSVQLAKSGKVVEALALATSARKAVPDYQVPAQDLNELCWQASLHGRAADVVNGVCEEAVRASPENTHFMDSRGFARALVGRRQQAIEDFEPYIRDESIPQRLRNQRQRWVQELRAGKNPFTEEEIRGLR